MIRKFVITFFLKHTSVINNVTLCIYYVIIVFFHLFFFSLLFIPDYLQKKTESTLC